MSADTNSSNAPTHPRLFGRDVVLDAIAGHVTDGRQLFALEGVTGVGKTELLAEICRRLGARIDTNVVVLDAAICPTEDLAIASIHSQLRKQIRDPAEVADRLRERLAVETSSTPRRILAAIVADLVGVVTDRADNTIEALRGAIAGDDSTDGVSEELEKLSAGNRRYFLANYLSSLADAEVRVVIAIDNVDSANESLVELIRVLLARKFGSLVIILVQNTEAGDNTNWTHLQADLRARGGVIESVGPMFGQAVSDWFRNAVGRWPSPTELKVLEEHSSGRALDLSLAIEAIRDGRKLPRPRDYLGYYEIARGKLDPQSRAVAELLAVLSRDAGVDTDLLAIASGLLGVDGFGAALDDLRERRLIRIDDGYVRLSHSLVQKALQATIDAPRRSALSEAWVGAVLPKGVAGLIEPSTAGLIHLVAVPLSRKFSARELAEVGSRLIESGRVDVGLELVDVGWRYSSDYAGNESMFQHALVSARTNLDLGRYSAVDEPLTAAERFAASNPAEMVQVVLLRMKLALRRNAYAVLFALFEQVLVLTSDDAISRIEAEIMLNAAWRDTNDLPKLQESVKRISLSCDSHPPSLQCSIDRALARSLVKLGSYDEAMLRAYSALSLSKASPYVRDIGTAHFACAEVRRYRKEFPAAVEHYEAAAGIGRATGNRDLLLWSLLGEAAAHVEARGVDRAVSPLGEVAALLNEPGYEHPLERAHESLLRLLSDGNVEKAVIVRSYAALKIYWPADFIAAVERTGEVTEAIPL